MFYINIKSKLIVVLYQTRENSIKTIIKLPLYFCCLFNGIIIIIRSSCRYSFNSKHTYDGSGAHSKVNIITNIGKLHVWSFLICQFTHAKKTRPTVIESFTRLPLLFIVALLLYVPTIKEHPLKKVSYLVRWRVAISGSYCNCLMIIGREIC